MSNWQDVLDDEKLWAIIYDDALETLRAIPTASVDALIADPPYGVGIAGWDKAVPPQAVLDECLRVSKGPVLWFGAARADMLFAFADYAPRPDRMLVWAPTFILQQTGHKSMFFRWHPIWCWRLPKVGKALHWDVLHEPQEGHHPWDHSCTKPLRLMERIVAGVLPDGGIVCDPYCGSGTTGVAAILQGCSFIGVDNEEKHCATSEQRILAATANPGACRARRWKLGENGTQTSLLPKEAKPLCDGQNMSKRRKKRVAG